MSEPVPLLLLPGLLCDGQLWAAQIDYLGRVAACRVADLTRDDSVGAMAARALAEAPPRFALAALSMGGYVAFEILRRAPERVIRLALVDTSAAPDTPDRAMQRRAAMGSLRVGRFLGVARRMLPQLVHSDHVSGPVGNTVQAMAARVGSEAFLHQQRAILERPDSRPLLGTIRVPTLVAVGEDDQLTPPADARVIHEGVTGSSLHLFARCGHLPPLESPRETGALLRDWLQSSP